MEQTATLHNGFDISGKLSKAKSMLVCVTGGIHQGAELAFDSGALTIGTEADNDMVLFAEEISPHHCRLVRSNNPFSPISVYALDGAVTINGKRTLNSGEYASLKGKFVLELNNCQITVAPAVEYSSFAVPALKIAMVLLLLFFAWIGWGLAGKLFSNVTSLGSSIGTSFNTGIGNMVGKDGQLAGAIDPQKSTSDKLVWTVRSKLEELGLNASVRATALGDGNIHLNGVVAKSQSGRWNEFLRWYDQNPAFPTLVRDIRKNANEPAVPKIQSVWLNGTPTVHFKSGKAARVGDEIGDGWQVKSIDRKGVTLSRDGSPVVLKY